MTCQFKVAVTEQIWKNKVPSSYFVLIVVPLVLDGTSRISSPAQLSKVQLKLLELNGVSCVKVSRLAAPSWKELGTGPVAFSAVCLRQLLSRGTGPSRQRDTAVPRACGRWRATRLQRPPALRDPQSLWWKPPSWAGKDGGGIHCPALSSPPSNTFHYSWMKNNPFKTIFTLAVIKGATKLLKSPYCNRFWNL